MEGIYLTPEDDDSDKESSTSKQKKAEAIGSFVVEPKNETQPPKNESLWQKLTGSDSEKPHDTPESEEDRESTQISELSPTELQVVERAFVQSRMIESSDETIEDVAVHDFHEKIIDESMTSEEALADTLEQLQTPETTEDNFAPTLEAPYQEFNDQPIEFEHSQPLQSTLPGNQSIPVQQPRESSPTVTPEVRAPRAESNEQLVDGIVGYLKGRRQGRISTEQQLLPIQEKLKQQVEAVQRSIMSKEQTIRRMVTERQQLTAQIEQSHETHAAEQAQSAEQLRRAQQTVIEAPVPISPQQAVERVKALPLAEQVASLPRRDILELAAKIVVEGVSVRQMFENNAITEKGMRRIIVEQLRGGDIKRALKREVIEHQIDFERDPIVRDKPRHASDTQSASSNYPPTPSDQQTAAEKKANLSRETAAARAKHEAFQSRKKTSQIQLLDIVMATVITILLMIVVGLVMARL